MLIPRSVLRLLGNAQNEWLEASFGLETATFVRSRWSVQRLWRASFAIRRSCWISCGRVGGVWVGCGWITRNRYRSLCDSSRCHRHAALHGGDDIIAHPFLAQQDHIVDVRTRRYTVGLDMGYDHGIADAAAGHVDDLGHRYWTTRRGTRGWIRTIAITVDWRCTVYRR